VDEALFRRFDLEQRLGYESIAEHSLTNDPYRVPDREASL